jgi:hypothetical protein
MAPLTRVSVIHATLLARRTPYRSVGAHGPGICRKADAMDQLFNPISKEKLTTLYVSSNGKAMVAFANANVAAVPTLQIRGRGTAKPGVAIDGAQTWLLEGLGDASVVQVFRNGVAVSAALPVKFLRKQPSYQDIDRRLKHRRIGIDLDAHIAQVTVVSDIVGEGVAFKPVDAAKFKQAIEASGAFHHDDRATIFGGAAASATVGEGYREISTPSLHVAISADLCSVHIDAYAFMLHGPDGTAFISPDVGQHIVDELLFRKPAPWMRRHTEFGAAVLQALHPVLPNSLNGYKPRLGLRLDLGDSPNSDIARGVPRLRLEATRRFAGDGRDKWAYSAELRLATGGNAQRDPDWKLTLKADLACRDVRCRDHDFMVGLVFSGTVP